jgi:hypothetical protein
MPYILSFVGESAVFLPRASPGTKRVLKLEFGLIRDLDAGAGAAAAS